MSNEKLYTWAQDFSNKRNTVLIKDSFITSEQKQLFEQVIAAYCPGHNTPYSSSNNSTTNSTDCNRGETCSYTVCGCGDDSANPAIGAKGQKWCTSNCPLYVSK